MAAPRPLGSPFLSFAALLMLAATAAARSASGDDRMLTQIPTDLYHSSNALLKKIKSLVDRHPNVLTLETMKAENKGYHAEIVVVTYDYAGSRKNGTMKFRILLSFGQHGRELITSEVALHLLTVVAGESRLHGLDSMSLGRMLENLVIKVVPMENVNGRKLVEAGDFCERRNGRGVDLNRNWSVDWGKKEKDYDPYEENPGTAPFSEPEAQIMRNLSKSFHPHIWVNVHSGMEALFMPYDHKNGTPSGLTSSIMRLLLQDLNHRHFREKCLVGPGGGSVGYFAHGTTTDYMYEIAKVPMPFTFEIYGDSTASSKDCFRMFNPVEKFVFDEVLSKWTLGFLALFEIGPRWLEKALIIPPALVKWVPIGGKVIDGSLVGIIGESKMEVLELGIKELRTYFRLFMLSSVLLLFMFCSRILKTKYRQAY